VAQVNKAKNQGAPRIRGESRGAAVTELGLGLFRGLGLHLIANRLGSRRNYFHSATSCHDLLGCGLGYMVHANGDLLGDFAFPKNTNTISRTISKADLLEGFLIDDCAVLEVNIDIADVNNKEVLVPRSVRETALGHTAEQRHLTAFEEEPGEAGACRSILTLATTTGGLAMTRSNTATNALKLLVGNNTLIDVVEIH